jgi:hypothetical protein
MIYFVKDTGSESIKIGYSKKPAKRLAGLQTANPHKLILLGTIKGTPEDETTIHARFVEYRLAGEWFRGEIIEMVLDIIAAEQKKSCKVVRGERMENSDTIQGVSQLPGLKMKSPTLELTEEPGKPQYDKNSVYCGVTLKYILEFEKNVPDDDLMKLRQLLFAGGGNPNSNKVRHMFFDEDNAVIPVFSGYLNYHVVGGPVALTGFEGDAFRVVVAERKVLRTDEASYSDDRYGGEHPLKKTRKIVVHGRG